MAQLAEPEPNEEIPTENKQKALCPFYGSSAGCSYLHNCPKSHSNPNSIELCNLYQRYSGCPNPSSCLYRHSLKPLTNTELNKLCKKHNISGKIHYSRIIKGKSVHRVIIIINQVLWYGIHFIIEDKRIQKIHYEKYSSIYHWNDAILVSEIICEILINSATPGKYLSYLKNLIDGDNEKNNNKNAPKKLIHYRDILTSIGNNFNKMPKPINPHIVANLSRVPWKDFKLFQLLPEVYDYPDIMLAPGDIVRIWRPKKFVYHCGIYLGGNKIIHISNGIQGDQGMNWRISGLFQSGSSPNNSQQKHKQYYDYGKKIRNEKKKENKIIIFEYYDDSDDMDLVNEEGNDEEKDIIFREKDDIREEKEIELLYQNIDEFECKTSMDEIEMENARRARLCDWKEFILGSRKKDLELGFFIFPWRTYDEIVYTAQFLTEIHYMKGQYSVYKNNCEHFALYCCTGLRYSPQANTLEKVINITSKITTFANNMFNKATSFRNNNNNNNNNEKKIENENENNNRNNHPIIQNKHIDDGGDDELEKLLLNNDDINRKINGKKVGNDMGISQEFDIIYNDNKNNNNKNNNIKEDIILIDEYANDEEDVLAESIIIETNENIKKDLMDMTPGGLTQSQILYAKKHNKWNV